MFENYHSSMEQLKRIYNALENDDHTDINFLSTVQNSIKYIESTWNSFSYEYQQTIEEEYAKNIIQEMISAIDAHEKNPDHVTAFNQACEVVGNRLKFYSGRKNRTGAFDRVQSSPEPEHKPEQKSSKSEARKQKKQKNKVKMETSSQEKPSNSPEEQTMEGKSEEQASNSNEQSVIPASGLENCFIIEIPENISNKARKEFLNNRKSNLLKRFNSRKKCTMLINFINAENQIIDSYGLFRNLELKETTVTPANKGELWKKCNTYFVNYSYQIEFNRTNFLRIPALNISAQEQTDMLPSSNLNFDHKIQLNFIGNQKENGFQIQFKISTAKPENWLENLFPMIKTLDIYTETRDNINDKPENIPYTIQQPKILKYYLSLKDEIKTEILIYLEF